MGVNEEAWGIGFKRMIGDPSLGNGETYGICVDETVRQIHICDIGDYNTDWARSISSHPELCIHSATTPESYYLKMYSAGATAYIDAVGATTLSILIDGTAELALTSSAFSPGVSNSSALGTTSLMWSDLFLASGAVINFNSDGLTITHAADEDRLTLATTWNTAAKTGRPFLVQLNVDNVRLGGYANAFKAYVVCDESGSSQGVLSVANFEISMPSTGGGEGVYTCTEHEMVCPQGYNSSGCIASFMYFNSAGDGEAEFDTTGDFFHIDTGITAGSGKILSAGSLTLRVGLGANAGTKRYLMMSSAEDTFTIASSATPLAVVAADYKLAVYTDVQANVSSGNVVPVYFEHQISGNSDFSGGQHLGTLNFLNIEGHDGSQTTLAANTCALSAMWYTNNDDIDLTAGVHAAIVAIQYFGDDISAATGAELCGIHCSNMGNATSAIEDGLLSGILISSGSGDPWGSAIKVTGCSNLFWLADDDVFASVDGNTATAGNPDGWIKINLGGYTSYIWTYDNIS